LWCASRYAPLHPLTSARRETPPPDHHHHNKGGLTTKSEVGVVEVEKIMETGIIVLIRIVIEALKELFQKFSKEVRK
jgi:hypothetical protein